MKSVVFQHEVKKKSHKTWSIFCALQDSPGSKEWTTQETLFARGMYPELLPCSMLGQRAARNQPHANKSLKFKQLSWHVAGSSKAQTCNQMTHATQSQPPSLLLCICSGAAVWQSCPRLWIKCGRELQTLLETRLLLWTIMHCAFWPPHSCSSALWHIAVCSGLWQHILHAVGGQELPGVQLLGSVSWPLLSPASALAPRLGRCTAHAGTLWGEQVGEQSVAGRTV